jgi:sugar O-acyltransferase (sialic acid O-acetyltransferase NeuD family)
MKRVVIIGAGGHAQEVADIIRHQPHEQIELVGFVIDQEYLNSPQRLFPILGDWSWFDGADRDELSVVCAVGEPAARKKMVERADSKGLSFARVISPLSYVSPDASVAAGSMIFPNAVISADVSLGAHTVINTGTTVSHETAIESYATICPGVHIAGKVTIGDGCYLGIGCSVIQGVSIGEWTTVGAGAVVVGDLPSRVTAAGVPARVIKTGGRVT